MVKKIIVIGGILLVLGIGNIVSADGGGGQGDRGGGTGNGTSTRTGLTTIPDFKLGDINPLPDQTISGLLERLINWLIVIAAPVAAGMVIFGAYQMLFAAGEPEKVKKGKATILYTVIGYGIILIGWGMVKVIENFLKGA